MPFVPSQHTLLTWQSRLSPLLYPAGLAYGAAMAVRRCALERQNNSHFSPAIPTVSIGNVAWGGTGKTPMVDWFLQWAKGQELSPAVLTRGYKASPANLPCLVRDESLAGEVGDEPLLLARNAPHASIIVDPVRTRAAAWAMANVNPDMFILDDGLQHLAMKRDMDFILMRPEDVGTQWNRIIPQGSWREGKSALKRASAFFFKMDDDAFADLAPSIEKSLAVYEKPVFSFTLRPHHLERVGYKRRGVHIENPIMQDFNGGAYMLISGVGEPSQVAHTAMHYFDYPPAVHRIFNDHHEFTLQDAQELAREAAQKNLVMLCTPKDAVKLERVMNAPLWTFSLETHFGPAMYTELCFADWWAGQWDILQKNKRLAKTSA